MRFQPNWSMRIFRWRAVVAAVVAAAITAGTIAVSPAGATTTAPTYRVELMAFTCFEETDEVGSDEIYATYDSPAEVGPLQSGRTNIVNNVDAFETHHWDPARAMIWGTPTAGRAVGKRGLTSVLTLWEHDDSKADAIADKVHAALGAVSDLVSEIPIVSWIAKALAWVSGAVAGIIGKNHDDFINKGVVRYDQASLAALLRRPGQSFADAVILKGDGGKYAVWLKVTRVK